MKSTLAVLLATTAVAQKVEDMEKERHEKSVVKVSDHLKKKASKK